MKWMFISPKYIIALLLIVVLATTIANPWETARAAPTGSESVIAWNTIMIRTVITVGQQPPPPSFVYATYAQTAVYNAVVAIEGGYQSYKSNLDRHPDASVAAAVATAAHNVLVHYFPLQQMALDTDYSTFMATIPDDAARIKGIDVGNAAAEELITLRTGDGLNADIGFSMPTPAPGVWQLPAGVSPQVPWMSKLKPFMLESPDQFRPGPPPDLGSDEWASEYNESLHYGRRDSTVRTPRTDNYCPFLVRSTDVPIQLCLPAISKLERIKCRPNSSINGNGKYGHCRCIDWMFRCQISLLVLEAGICNSAW